MAVSFSGKRIDIESQFQIDEISFPSIDKAEKAQESEVLPSNFESTAWKVAKVLAVIPLGLPALFYFIGKGIVNKVALLFYSIRDKGFIYPDKTDYANQTQDQEILALLPKLNEMKQLGTKSVSPLEKVLIARGSFCERILFI